MAVIKKPSKLLNRRATAANKDITRRNASESALLRLPPELRNRIWGLVLGGNVLHISNSPGAADNSLDWRNTVCPHAGIRRSRGYKYSRCRRRYGLVTVYHARHIRRGCGVGAPTETQSSLSLAMLRVSRQVHLEAALLPYLMNTFAFYSTSHLQAFIDSLLPVQRRNIRNLLISSNFGLRHPIPSNISQLCNLTNLTIHTMLVTEDINNIFTEKTLQRLEKLPLSKVVIRTTAPIIMSKLEVKKVARLTREIEQRLLGKKRKVRAVESSTSPSG